MHKRRIMALARSGLCRLPSSHTEALALRAGFLPMMPKSLATAATARTLDLYRLPARSLPTTSLLRLIGGPSLNCQVLTGIRDIWFRRGVSKHAIDSTKALPKTFDQANIGLALKAAIREHNAFGYEKMSPVQQAVLSRLPELVQPGDVAPLGEMDATKDGKVLRVEPPSTDLLVQSRTGSGKTLAYLIAAATARQAHFSAMRAGFRRRMDDTQADKLATNRMQKVIGALILVPNRGIAYDIARVAEHLLSRTKSDVQLWVTDGDWNAQRSELHEKSPDIFVATPSRIINGLQPRLKQLLAQCPLVIYDEADAMMDPGNVRMINKIRDSLLPKDHQTWLVSATIPDTLRAELIDRLRPGYEVINTLDQDLRHEHAIIPQYVTVAPTVEAVWPHLFYLLAHDALLHPQGGKAIVFMPSVLLAKAAATLTEALARALPWGDKLHVFVRTGQGVTANEKEQIYSMFSRCRGAYAVLFATDISSRGLDYQDVTRVIQFGVPEAVPTYTHRIGRTSRGGKSGRADTILFPWEVDCPHEEMFGDHQVQPVSVEDIKKEVLTLAKSAQSESAYALQQRTMDRVLDQHGSKMPRDVGLRLARLDDELQSRGLPALEAMWVNNTALVAKTFTGMVAHWKMMTGRIRRRFETLVRAIEALGADALRLPGDLKVYLRDQDRELIDLEPVSEAERALLKSQLSDDAYALGKTTEQRRARRVELKEMKKEAQRLKREKRQAFVEAPLARFRPGYDKSYAYEYEGPSADRINQERRRDIRRVEKKRLERERQLTKRRLEAQQAPPRTFGREKRISDNETSNVQQRI